jgi:hypothetical protein
MSNADFRNAIRGVLAQFNRTVEDAIRRELAGPIDLGHSGRFQFEVCGYFYGIHLVQTEEVILEDSVLQDAIPEALTDAAAEADIDSSPYDILGEELFPWLADRWNAAGGPGHFSPAYAFYHGGLDEPRYDLERRRWCEVEEVWPDEE